MDVLSEGNGSWIIHTEMVKWIIRERVTGVVDGITKVRKGRRIEKTLDKIDMTCVNREMQKIMWVMMACVQFFFHNDSNNKDYNVQINNDDIDAYTDG